MNISLSDGEGTVQANIFGHNTRDIEMCGVIKGKVAIVSIVYRGSGYYLNDILGNYDPEITV